MPIGIFEITAAAAAAAAARPLGVAEDVGTAEVIATPPSSVLAFAALAPAARVAEPSVAPEEALAPVRARFAGLLLPLFTALFRFGFCAFFPSSFFEVCYRKIEAYRDDT